MLTKDQISGIADRVLVVLGTWLVAKGYLTTSQVTEYIPILLAIVTAVWGWYVNRPQNILQSAAAIPNPSAADGKTHIVASPELAAATPEKNIQSSNSNEVVSK